MIEFLTGVIVIMKYFLPIAPIAVVAIVVSGCLPVNDLNHGPEPTTTSYTEPKASGLIQVRAYPNPGDVCQVIGENELTAELLDDDSLLIGCPKHEKGAIADRMRDGAKIVGFSKHWTLLNIKDR